ncbi:hypothetical protein PCNPT3_12920 [Psychromonas sp. CNPT3]|uniref:membrane protein insertion efficiency factor YidD n=1 Tax=Psychromonas sp. CNPT3 TaxID=314282 RepID=UPI0002C05C24|nr:membrane protein insertion efficiency factor YidD [Psychromonas sp. CNPT3]AGH82520.1 hypothetical protein PCNPT3_12920 [Psychromonas sp. CNPT3]
MAKISAALQWLTIKFIRGYQLGISPLLPPRCRFMPTCSQYAIEAIKLHGIVKGGWLASKRLIKCQPFIEGGYDPVPTCCVKHDLINKRRD